MTQKTYVEAIQDAFTEEMKRDETVYLAGEDVGPFGGNFGETAGLYDEFGPERVRDTTISEVAIVGHAIGAAVAGMRPVACLQFASFAGIVGDELVNQAGRLLYTSGGQMEMPMVVFAPAGAGISAAAQHSQAPHSWVSHQPGLVVVTPTTPYDAKGLLKSAIRDENPVVFLPHVLLTEREGEVPDEEYTLPLGEAAVEREGSDVTVVANQLTFHHAMEAAEELAGDVDVEIVSPRTVAPMDFDTIGASVQKTSRLVVVDESPLRYGLQPYVAGEIASRRFFDLDAPPVTIGVKDVPIPFSPPLEQEVLPDKDRIVEGIKSVF
ncbi:MAG: alpha-ketoacid dehydrogenase subunit beta [archaeon]